mmetsp:Transcript_32836/g.64369  ORF Transcript_32836/g.64369 Transcript_32836/m.64369 type:complete len:107 (-) Transcript_32836:52-372(-)
MFAADHGLLHNFLFSYTVLFVLYSELAFDSPTIYDVFIVTTPVVSDFSVISEVTFPSIPDAFSISNSFPPTISITVPLTFSTVVTCIEQPPAGTPLLAPTRHQRIP